MPSSFTICAVTDGSRLRSVTRFAATKHSLVVCLGAGLCQSRGWSFWVLIVSITVLGFIQLFTCFYLQCGLGFYRVRFRVTPLNSGLCFLLGLCSIQYPGLYNRIQSTYCAYRVNRNSTVQVNRYFGISFRLRVTGISSFIHVQFVLAGFDLLWQRSLQLYASYNPRYHYQFRVDQCRGLVFVVLLFV